MRRGPVMEDGLEVGLARLREGDGRLTYEG